LRDKTNDEPGMFWFIFIASIYLTILVLVSIFGQKAGPRERRVALVIGNAAYKLAPLNNPTKDASDIADALNRLGYEVVECHDLGVAQMRSVIANFEAKARAADWALVYYSGHGMAWDGENWLIPIDARLVYTTDIPVQAVSVEHVLRHLRGAKKLRIVILDACRVNPLHARMLMNEGLSRVMTEGLARMMPACGEIVFFAARHNKVALDGKKGENSPFAWALLKHLGEDGLELGRFFRKVTSSVLAATNNFQEPHVYGRIPDEDFYLRPRP
jgi:uncharacterized caspase-like protein